MKFKLAALAFLTVASPTLAAAFLNHGPVVNHIYRGGPTSPRIEGAGIEQRVAFVGPAGRTNAVRTRSRCRGARVAATPPSSVRMPIAA